jgi:hypothetical protein
VNYLFSQRLPPSGQETDRAGALIYYSGKSCYLYKLKKPPSLGEILPLPADPRIVLTRRVHGKPVHLVYKAVK